MHKETKIQFDIFHTQQWTPKDIGVTFKIMEKEIFQLRILYSVKLWFESKGKIKTFLGKPKQNFWYRICTVTIAKEIPLDQREVILK